MMIKKITFALCILSSLFFLPIAQAQSLQAIMKYALTQDPAVIEARLQILVAESQVDISKAGHQPVISVSNTGVLAQQHRHQSDRRSEVALNGRINLYSFGAIEAEVERDQHLLGSQQQRFIETRENLGQQIGVYYLAALRAKENRAIYQESLARHNKLVGDLGVITSYDAGRISELNEAQSRRNQVETMIATQERILYSNLSRLSRYIQQEITVDSLSDPFAKIKTKAFLQRYQSKDILDNPSFVAQQKEVQSADAAMRAEKARRLPAINLEGSASRHEREVYLSMSWDLYNPAASATVKQRVHSKAAADAKLQEIALTVAEQSRTAEEEMRRNEHLLALSSKQIALQRKVVENTELQFEIARKSLINVLDAYQDLTEVQASEVAARNDYRDAALLYLISQSKLAQWAGVPHLTFGK